MSEINIYTDKTFKLIIVHCLFFCFESVNPE